MHLRKKERWELLNFLRYEGSGRHGPSPRRYQALPEMGNVRCAQRRPDGHWGFQRQVPERRLEASEGRGIPRVRASGRGPQRSASGSRGAGRPVLIGCEGERGGTELSLECSSSSAPFWVSIWKSPPSVISLLVDRARSGQGPPR